MNGTEMKHEGGCLCGSVRFVVTGSPERVGVCHCRYCQLRTGTAFGIGVYVKRANLEVVSGDLSSYEMTTQNGNTASFEFCANCATTLFWEVSAKRSAGVVGTSGGCYDPPTFWYNVDREVFSRPRAHFCTMDAAETHETHPSYDPKFADDQRLDGGV